MLNNIYVVAVLNSWYLIVGSIFYYFLFFFIFERLRWFSGDSDLKTFLLLSFVVLADYFSLYAAYRHRPFILIIYLLAAIGLTQIEIQKPIQSKQTEPTESKKSEKNK
jgi:hypothetical protein